MALPRRRRKTPSAINDVPLTPLIDTALTLLIIFMVTTPMMQNAIKVTLPEGKAKEDGGAKQDLIVYIQYDEKQKILKKFFNGLPITDDSLVNTVKRSMGNNKECIVFVKADGTVPYQNVIKVVDQLKVAGGIRYVALATQKAA